MENELKRGKITVAEVMQKNTRGGKPYLNVKSDKNAWAFIWEDDRIIWPLFKVGETLEIEYTTDGKFTTIKNVVGFVRPEPSGGIVIATNKTEGVGYWLEKIYQDVMKMHEMLEFLVEEKKALTVPPVKEKDEERPSLDDDINISDIPF